jgi:hypothetical protein
MDKIKEIEIDGVKHIIIDRGNDEFTSMPKSVYDAQAKELTESLPPVDPAK